MSKSNRFRKATFTVLPRGTIREATPGLGEYKVWCPKCDRAAIASVSVRKCPFDGQPYCPPEQPRVFR